MIFRYADTPFMQICLQSQSSPKASVDGYDHNITLSLLRLSPYCFEQVRNLNGCFPTRQTKIDALKAFLDLIVYAGIALNHVRI